MSKKKTFLCLMTSITLTGVILIEIRSNYFHKDDEKQNDSFKKMYHYMYKPLNKSRNSIKSACFFRESACYFFWLYKPNSDYSSLDSSNHTQLTAGT